MIHSHCIRWIRAGSTCALVTLVLAAIPALAATYEVEQLGVPRFVSTNYIDLARVTQLTRFRSSAGHDYADGFETCRSMKHYFMAPDATTTIVAPVAGTVTNVFDEWSGTQVQITAASQPAFTFVIFHVKLGKPLRIGESVAEGQLLGTHSGLETFSDIAVRVETTAGMRLVSYFSTLTDTAFAPFQARGIATREQLIITRAERDAAPYRCSGDKFTGLATPADMDYVSLSGNAPPTASLLINGPLSSQTLGLSVTPPELVRTQNGTLFIAALFPVERGGTLYFLAASGAWIPYTGCASAPGYRQGTLQAAMGATLIAAPTDLTKHRGVVVYAGYGIGSTWAAACNNMLQSRSYAAVYTVQ